MKKFWEIVGVLAAVAAAFYAYKNDFSLSMDNESRELKKLCQDFLIYGQAGTISDHLDMFTSEVSYYSAGVIPKEEIKNYFIPSDEFRDTKVYIEGDKIAIDKKSNVSTFRLVLEEYEEDKLVSKTTEITKLYFVKEDKRYKVSGINNGKIRVNNFQDNHLLRKNSPEKFSSELIMNEQYFIDKYDCQINGNKVNIRKQPSLRSSKVKDSFGRLYYGMRNEQIELISKIKIESTIEGVHKSDRYGFLLLRKGSENSNVYIVESGVEAILPNSELLIIDSWYKIRLRNGKIGFIAPNLISCN